MLQKSIESHFGVTIESKPLRTFLDRFYTGSVCGSIDVHRRASTVARAAMVSDDAVTIEPVYTGLRKLFLETGRTIGDLTVLLKKFAIRLSSQSVAHLFVRMHWEIEADNEFTVAMGADTALVTQN